MENENKLDVVELNQKMTTNALAIAITAIGEIGALKAEIINSISESTGEPIPEIDKRIDKKSRELMKLQLDKLSVRLGTSFENLSDMFEQLNESHS